MSRSNWAQNCAKNPFSACNPEMWHHLPTVWNRKRGFAQEVQNKPTFPSASQVRFPQGNYCSRRNWICSTTAVFWESLQAFFRFSISPTSCCYKNHCLKVCFQILEWKGIANEVSPLNWEQKRCDAKLIPVFMDLPPAPDELLKMIRWSCQTVWGACAGNTIWNVLPLAAIAKGQPVQTLIPSSMRTRMKKKMINCNCVILSLPISVIITYRCKNIFKLDVIPWFGHYLWNHSS